MRRLTLSVLFLFLAALPASASFAQTWRSDLYPADWTPPQDLPMPPSFETAPLIQDFSYAGYRRSETPLPQVAGPIFDAVEDFGADPSGDSDTTAAIQAAIDAAADAGGGVVYLAPGTYRVRPQGSAPAALRIRHSHIVLRGAGPDQTFLLNDAWQMRNKDILRVDSPGSGWATVPDESPVIRLREDLLGPATVIPVEDTAGLSPGDWIVLRADPTEAFKAEHNMADLWGEQNLGAGVLFVRQILTLDAAANTLTIDVPTRYYLKTRDDARLHLLGPHIDEVGIEDLAIGNVEHPNHGDSSGWGLNDYNVEGTNAHDVHGSYALRLTRVRNSWVRNVRTFRPPQNTRDAHVLSNALRIGNSVAVTIQDSHFQRALYSGGGGNAYMVRITNAQEVLVQDTTVGYNRHGFVFSHMQTSGNVILRGRAEHTRWRAIGGNAGSSGSDHHMHLSQSNLIDNTQLNEDYFAAYYRHTWGSNHGQTSVHSVYWNLEGLAYYSGVNHIVNTQQARYGYAIGTRGPASGISTAGVASFAAQAWRTDPPDHVEGQGQGDTLEPRSLFVDQLRRRSLAPDPPGRVAAPLITPAGGTYLAPRAITLTSDTAGAEIRYTLDGSSPSPDALLYDGPITLDASAQLRALAFSDGLVPSRITVADFAFPASACSSVTDTWQNTPISNQSGAFELHLQATPQDAEMNAVMGLSDGDARRYQDLAAIVRFSPDGLIDARDGSTYAADLEIPFEPGATYHFRFLVDLPAATYDVYVQPDGADEVLLAQSFAFRTEQSHAFTLNRLGLFAAVGTNEVCDLLLPADLPAPDLDEPTPDPDAGHADPADTGLEPPDPGDDTGLADDTTVVTSGCACSSTPGPGVPLPALLFLLAMIGAWGRRWLRSAPH